MGKTLAKFLVIAFWLLVSGAVYAQQEIAADDDTAVEDSEAEEGAIWDRFIDEEDGMFDASDWLGSQFGFMPVPILITGPTFGNGLGLNLLFLHDSFVNKSAESGRYIPPSISGIAYAATENDTTFAGAYHLGFLRQDTLRSTSFVGRPDANLSFYPDIPIIGEREISMNLEGWAGYQELKWRLGESNFFAGGNYLYLDTTTSPNDTPSFLPGELFEQDITIASLAAVFEYDSRNSIFTPDQGLYGKLVAARYDESVGSDFDFWNYRGKAYYFQPASERLTMGLRTEAQSVDGKAPFFMYPSIEMRGIANARYQGQHTFVAEVEGRWALDSRWSLIGFAGSGKAFGNDTLNRDRSFSEADWEGAVGVGFRYKMARKFGLHAGLDYAVGPEDESIYITVGQAWNAFF